MKELQNRRLHDSEKSFPGCMGRMANLFDLSPSMASNRLLMEKPHRDGSPRRGGQPDVTKKVSDPFGNQIEDKPVVLKSSSNKKSNRTPMKTLIAKEMLKETESKRRPPSVVAKLMGLDGLPNQQPVPTGRRGLPEGYLRDGPTRLGPMTKHDPQENGFLDKQMHGGMHPSRPYAQEEPAYKDVREVWQKSPKINYIKDHLQQKGRPKDNTDEKIALVRRKFIEAKRLATDEQLQDSEEFQDALEILTSNRDLFVEFLQEPNSLLTKQFCELPSIPPPPQTKRITILKPSVEVSRCAMNSDKLSRQVLEATKRDKDNAEWPSIFSYGNAENSPQPTRIVVLKPSPGRTHDIKPRVPSPTLSSRLPQSRDFFDEPRNDAARGSREAAKDITPQMQESMSRNTSHDDLISSALLNGYVGNESSLNRSENELTEEGKFSGSETMTLTSRHSWDHINRYNSSYSSSSLSQASYSPDSAVTREAKKRLSERLALMKSAESSQEERPLQRSSLGEMLALPQLKKPIRSAKDDVNGGPTISTSRSCGGEQELRGPIACLLICRNEGVDGKNLSKNLFRSKSVPVSSTVYEKVRLSVDAPAPTDHKPVTPKEAAKSTGKLFKGKVSSLFFSRNKKPTKEKTTPHPSLGSNNGFQSVIAELPSGPPEIKQLSVENKHVDVAQCVTDNGLEEKLPLNLGGPLHDIFIHAQVEQGTLSSEEVLTLGKSGTPENSSERQDQPSPISVLEGLFEDEVHTSQSENVSSDYPGSTFDVHMLSDSTSDSPIESVACSLSCNCDCSESSTGNPIDPPAVSSIVDEEEREWFWFVQILLSSVGLDCRNSNAVFPRWHAAESPLDPELLNKFTDHKEDEEQQNETKHRQQRSEKRLIFDTVNAALVEMTGSRLKTNPWANPCSKRAQKDAPVVELVWSQLREWFFIEAKWFCGESDTSMLIERVMRKEIGGREWEDLMGLEADKIGVEIAGKMLEELVNEALPELTCKL